MSDIVWAINPQKDHLHDLAQRMRRHASEVFPASEIQFSFHAQDESKDLTLGADLRRQVFLIFKESVNNIVRHSGCDRAEVNLSVEGPRLVLEVTDNGRGFDASNGSGGNGLQSMRRRAASLGGEFHLTSRNGTTITLRVPYGSPRL
jgi:signal transduction histidine kinase